MKRKNVKESKPISEQLYLEKLINFSEFVDDGIAKVKIEGNEKLHTILKISGIDIFGCSQVDKEQIYDTFSLATISLHLPHKYIFTNSNPVLQQQKEYLEYKYKVAKQPFIKQLLQRELNSIKNIESSHKDKIAYLFIFADVSELQILKNNISNYLVNMSSVSVETCDNVEYQQIMYQLLTQADTGFAIKNLLNESILPDSIDFSNNYYRVNENNYVTCIKINEYPSYIDDLLFANLFSNGDITVTLDVNATPPDIVNTLKNSLSEINSRGAIPQNVSERIDDIATLDDLTQLYQNLSRGNEKLLTTTVRFYISASSFDELNTKAENLKNSLENIGIKVFVETNSMIEEFKSLASASDTMKQVLPLHDTYKRQFPFYYQSLIDAQSYMFGYTLTGGIVLFNNFLKNSRMGRDSFDTLIFGSKGAGKSVTLKSMLQSNLMFGNKAMIIDVENEYRTMASVLGGKVIDMNRNSIINVLHLHMTIDSNAESDTEMSNEVFETNYASELSRISTFFYQYYPTMSNEQNAILVDMLDVLYKKFNIYPSTDITQIPTDKFPIMSDFYDLLMSESHHDLALIIKPLSVGAYASIFNGHSTIDIASNDFIVFNVKNLSEMDEKVYNAQLFNILTLMWSEVAKNYSFNAKIKNSWDRRYVICLIDEAHRFINTKNKQVTEFIEKLTRRSRKYFSGLWFATQNITDFVPSLANSNTDTIRTIFSLCQYKMIMKQDYECIGILEDIFPQFTKSELMSVPTFSAGTMLMSVSAGRQKVTTQKFIPTADFFYIGTPLDVLDSIKQIYLEYYRDISPIVVADKLLIPEGEEKFKTIFTDEVFTYLSYDRNCSEPFEKIIESAIIQLIVELKKGVTLNA